MIGFSAQQAMIESGAAGDPLWSDVSVLLPFEEDTTDVITKTWNVFGNAAVTTGPSPFGTKSLALDGSGDYLQALDDARVNLYGLSAWTIEGFIYYPTTPTKALSILLMRRHPVNGLQYAIGIPSTGVPYIQWMSGSTNYQRNAVGAFTAGSWNHFAAVLHEGNVKIYLNGVGSAPLAYGAGMGNVTSTALTIGRDPTNSTRDLAARLAWIRITKAARYTADFTPPSAPFPTGP